MISRMRETGIELAIDEGDAGLLPIRVLISWGRNELPPLPRWARVRSDLRLPVYRFTTPAIITMIARSTTGRLAGVPVALLLWLTLHQQKAASAVLGQQDVEAQPAVSARTDDKGKVTAHLFARERSVQGQVQKWGRSGTSWMTARKVIKTDLRRGSPELPCLALMLQCRRAKEEDFHEPRNSGA